MNSLPKLPFFSCSQPWTPADDRLSGLLGHGDAGAREGVSGLQDCWVIDHLPLIDEGPGPFALVLYKRLHKLPSGSHRALARREDLLNDADLPWMDDLLPLEAHLSTLHGLVSQQFKVLVVYLQEWRDKEVTVAVGLGVQMFDGVLRQRFPKVLREIEPRLGGSRKLG